MRMSAIVLGANVRESVFFDQASGAPKPGYSVNMSVIDAETNEKFECQFSGGFAELEALKQLRQQGGTVEQAQVLVNQLNQSLPPQLSRLDFEVVRIKGKGSFLTLVCRFLQTAAVA